MIFLKSVQLFAVMLSCLFSADGMCSSLNKKDVITQDNMQKQSTNESVIFITNVQPLLPLTLLVVTAQPQQRSVRRKDVYCCGCDVQDSMGVATSALWFQGRWCSAIFLESVDCMQCCCRRTVEDR